MFPDLFLPNFAIFALGVVAAIYLLRTGMVLAGFLLLAAVATAIDIALVARFVYETKGGWYSASLWFEQAAALAGATWLAFALARRKWSADARARTELLAAAMQHYLRGELAAAKERYQRVRRADPWDVPAAIGLANVRWRLGQLSRARSLLLAAKRLDRAGLHADFVAEQQRRVQRGQPRVRRGSAASAEEPKAAVLGAR